MCQDENEIVVSIIIPVYNAEKYLDKCFQSILNQTFQSYEVIVVNDGSVDRSDDIIKIYMGIFKFKMKYYVQENKGQSAARNYALQYALGKYITFLDSDDYIDSRYLQILVERAETNYSDMVVSGQNKVDEKGNIISKIRYPVDSNGSSILRRFNFSGKLYKKDLIEKHNIKFAEGKIYEDNPFNFVMYSMAHNLVFIEYEGYNQTCHAGSTTTKKITESSLPLEEIEKAIKYIIRNLNQVNDKDMFEYMILSWFTYFIFVANKKHQYLFIEGRKSDRVVLKRICRYVMNILHENFPQYNKNKYLKLFYNKKLNWKQRIGVLIFVTVCRWNLLEETVKIYYLV